MIVKYRRKGTEEHENMTVNMTTTYPADPPRLASETIIAVIDILYLFVKQATYDIIWCAKAT